MKICQKKNISTEDETVLVQLERRHTLKEDANEVDLEDNLRKTTRANSLGNFEKGNASTDIEAVIAKKQNKCTRKPTVITESELSSSWLYKDRKAKINSDDENIEDLMSTKASENHEDIESRTLEDPNLKPVPVSNQRPRKKSSCCWYFAIVLAIFIACLVVMTGIGGIVFMEFFATHELADSDKLVKNENPSASRDTFQHSSHEQGNLHRYEPVIPENILNDFKNSTLFLLGTDVSRKEVITTSQPEENIFHGQKLTNSKDSKTEGLKKIKSNFVYENQDVVMAEQSKTAEFTDMSRYILDKINNFKVPASDKFVKIKPNTEHQNLSDFKFNYQSGNHNMDQIPDVNVDKSNKQMVENESIPHEISNFESEVSNASEDFLHERNFNFEMTSLKGFESKMEQMISNISFQSLPKQNSNEHSAHLLPNVNFLGRMNNTNDDSHEDNLFDHKDSIDHDPKDSLNHTELPIDNKAKNEFLDPLEHSIDHILINNSLNQEHLIDHSSNSLEHVAHSINQSSQGNTLKHIEHFIDHSPKNNSLEEIEYSIDPDNSSEHNEHSLDHNDTFLNDYNEDSTDFDSDGSSFEEHSLSDDEIKNSNDSAQLVFIRPVVESKAIPVPFAFLKRIGFDIKNPVSHQPMSANDMDIKFSLAEALKYLRSLDADNKLPDSRDKTATGKTINQKENKKKLPSITEREGYLNTLRKQIFEESM